jgi:3-dehydroquinate synthase
MCKELKIEFSHTLVSEIHVGKVEELLPTLLPEGRVVAVVDRNVSHLCDRLGVEELFVVDACEEAKSIDTAAQIWSRLVEVGADRNTFLLGIGGGITTDLVGFVAATYMRGIRFGLVPTTLLAQVDAAIGGKCGVNFGGYKNMVGAFAPARWVVCDVSLLYTLGHRELRSGMAEVIKTAILGDAALFALCEQNNIESLAGNDELFGEVVRRAAAVKCAVVQRDLLEGGERKKLNLGHTLAHAIESLTREYTHGEAVAIGLAYVAAKSLGEGLLSQGDHQRIVAVLQRYDLPTSVSLPEDDLWAAMGHDKKNKEGRIGWVLPTGIGELGVSQE